MSLETQQNLENQYVMGTFARKPVDFVSGSGMMLKDDAGREYIDFIGGIGACSLGHCPDALVGAIKDQAETLIHVSNYYYIEKRGEVAKMISDMLNEGKTEKQDWKSFFANSGAEANECSIKLARLYARRKWVKAGNEPMTSPRTIVVLERSFHGRTLATLAATAQQVKQEWFQPLDPAFVTTPINDVPALEKLFEEQGDHICGMLIEPIQGESGVHPCTAEFIEAIRRLTKKYGAMMICDEVQCGIYRAGTYPYAFQHYGVTPDIVSMAKGIGGGFPCGVSAARAEVAAAFEPGDHGSTFGGSNLAIAAIYATLNELQAKGIPAQVTRVGKYFQEKLAGCDKLANVRGKGLMVAVDFTDAVADDAPAVVARALEAGLVLNYTGPRTLRFLPPLICEESDIDAMLAKFFPLL